VRKIVYIFDGFGRGGAQQAFLTLLPLIKNELGDNQIDLILIHESLEELSIPMEVSHVYRLQARNMIDIKPFLMLCKILRENRYDKLVANLFWSQMWSACVPFGNHEMIWIEHNTYFTRTKLQWIVYRYLARRTKGIISVSSDVHNYLQQRKIRSNIVYNPVSIDANNRNSATRREDFLFAGRLNKQKNPLLALDAFFRFLMDNVDKKKDTALLFCGEGPMRIALEQRAAKLGISSQVRFLGSLNQTDLFVKMTECSTLISTSLYEGFALVRIEAVAHGMCVVSTDTGGMRETLLSESGQKGIFVAKSEAEDIALLMAESLRPEHWSQEAVRRRKSIAKKFEPKNLLSRYSEKILS
jgi:glycosyltransferase involved in cell wall biosynthesis